MLLNSSLTFSEKLRSCAVILALVSIAGVGTLQAAVCDGGGNLIGNCGFGDNTTGSLSLWTVTPGVVDTSNQAPVVDGFYARITGVGSGNANLTQQIQGIIGGMQYNYSFVYRGGSNPNNPPDQSTFQIFNSANTFNITQSLVFNTNWVLVQGSFTAPSGSDLPLFIRFNQNNSFSFLATTRIDNVIVTPVPEPASLLLLGSLCSAAVGYGWKRKKNF